MKILTQEREALGLTRAELAARAHMHASFVGQMELDRLRPPAESVMLARLARALHYPGRPIDLLDDVEEGVLTTKETT